LSQEQDILLRTRCYIRVKK